MADNETGLRSGSGSGLVNKMTVIAETVQELQKGQKSFQSAVESKLDRFQNEFLANIDNKFKAMRSDIDLELGIHKKNIDNLAESIIYSYTSGKQREREFNIQDELILKVSEWLL